MEGRRGTTCCATDGPRGVGATVCGAMDGSGGTDGGDNPQHDGPSPSCGIVHVCIWNIEERIQRILHAKRAVILLLYNSTTCITISCNSKYLHSTCNCIY